MDSGFKGSLRHFSLVLGHTFRKVTFSLSHQPHWDEDPVNPYG